MEENLEQVKKFNNEISDNTKETNLEEQKEPKPGKINNINDNKVKSQIDSSNKIDMKSENDISTKNIPIQKKELPIEKKPFQEFINIHLIPALVEEISHRGLEINNIDLKNTNRPIAEDRCWVINCEIKNTCSFWLSFEKDDISSLKSISLYKPNQKPSIIE